MKWIKGEQPKKTEFTGLIGSPTYLVRFYNNQKDIRKWYGDRWNHYASKGNPITHYMLIEEVK